MIRHSSKLPRAGYVPLSRDPRYIAVPAWAMPGPVLPIAAFAAYNRADVAATETIAAAARLWPAERPCGYGLSPRALRDIANNGPDGP